MIFDINPEHSSILAEADDDKRYIRKLLRRYVELRINRGDRRTERLKVYIGIYIVQYQRFPPEVR